MIISLIVAMDEKGAIGKDGKLPWHLYSDLKRFKSLTMGHHIIMGRKTFESIGFTLPGRTMIVLTRNRCYHPKDCIVLYSLEEAIAYAENHSETELFIIGGGDIFAQSIGLANKIYLTRVHADMDADVFFPEINEAEWKIILSEESSQHEKDSYPSDFKIYVRIINDWVDKSKKPHIIRQTGY